MRRFRVYLLLFFLCAAPTTWAQDVESPWFENDELRWRILLDESWTTRSWDGGILLIDLEGSSGRSITVIPQPVSDDPERILWALTLSRQEIPIIGPRKAVKVSYLLAVPEMQRTVYTLVSNGTAHLLVRFHDFGAKDLDRIHALISRFTIEKK